MRYAVPIIRLASVAWPWLLLAIVVGAFLVFAFAYRKWKKGWLSGSIADRLSRAQTKQAADQRNIADFRARSGDLWLASLEKWDRAATYFKSQFVTELKTPYFPSPVSFIIIFLLIAAFFVLSRPPSLAGLFQLGPYDWWRALTANLDTTSSHLNELIVGAFTGLVVVVIALIVFVAESIRDDSDYERKRTLVRVSWLWPLGLAATVIPFGFLWSAARGLTILLEIIVAAVTLLAFGRVVRSLFDPDTRAQNRLSLLRNRVRAVLFDSVQERIGNSILMEQLGPGKAIESLNYTISRSWIENDAQGYIFVDAPVDGWIADIQLSELRKLADQLDRYARDNFGFGLRESGTKTQRATTNANLSLAPEPRVPVKKAYLLKRYREEIPSDSIFYGKQRALFALPEAFSRDSALLANIRTVIPHIFRFTKDEPSSVAMRREMQGTKDQLTRAIRENALGTIEELRQTYLRVAEEFLRLLVEYGGGYSAEQAQKERGSFFESWTEIHWLLTDIRELIIISVDAGNVDIAGAATPSLVINQVDDKNAFIAQEHTSYAGWGRSYGEGLAQGEDESVFAAIVGGVSVHREVEHGQITASISSALGELSLRNPIILHSLDYSAWNDEIQSSETFTPKYKFKTRTHWAEYDGFMGFLLVGKQEVPVFDVFVRRQELRSKVVILDGKGFLRWDQFAPGDASNDGVDVTGALLIRVTDLNADLEQRNTIIAQNPPWLAAEGDPNDYLRGRVLINVDEKFRIEILNPSMAACLNFTVEEND